MDGEIDYSQYSLQQLREVEAGINRNVYPKNFARVVEELHRRGQAPREQPRVAQSKPRIVAPPLSVTWRRVVRDTACICVALALVGGVIGFVTGPFDPANPPKPITAGFLVGGAILYTAIGLFAPIGRWVHIWRVAVLHFVIAMTFSVVLFQYSSGTSKYIGFNVLFFALVGGTLSSTIARFRH